MNIQSFDDFEGAAAEMQQEVVNALNDHDSGELHVDGDLKGHHRADESATQAIIEYCRKRQLRANIFIEGHPKLENTRGNSDVYLFIDPVDGSVNRDLKIGDPAFVIAAACVNQPPTFGDLRYGYVYGLHSKELYTANGVDSFYRNGKKPKSKIVGDASVDKLENARLFWNIGYGSRFANSALRRTQNLVTRAGDIRGFDNTATEICLIARGAAHIKVEARSHTDEKGNKKGSDHANLLAQFTIGRTANVQTTDLRGHPLSNTVVNMDRVQDYISASHPKLIEEAVKLLVHDVPVAE